MSATIRDIADQLGLSSSTVSRVLSSKNRALISKATSHRVLMAAQEMRYRPNYAARSLATGRTNMIAFWSPGFHVSFFNTVAHQIQRKLRDNGYETIMGELGNSREKPFGELGLTRWKVDGIIMNGSGDWLDAYLQNHPSREVPLVHISVQNSASVDLVWLDLYPASRQAVQSLLDGGRKRIAHMLTASTDYAGGRRGAYQDVLREAGRKPEYISVPQGNRPDSRRMMKQYVRSHGCPDAIFCANDEMAIGAYRGLRDLGIKIPDDVALVGCDGIEDTEYLDTPLTTIVQPVKQMCDAAWQLLRARMDEPDAPIQRVVLEPQLVIRDSSGMES
jgi:LacI family transcriptional regulator